MLKTFEVEYLDIEENKTYEETVELVINKCFEIEKLDKKYLYINIIFTNPTNIRKLNKEYRKIDKETDVLSFPIFEKDELINYKSVVREALGDVVISIEQVKKQAVEYGHDFTRELSYMLVHGFYHLMGYDHIEENDKKEMREKEENVLNELKILR